MPRGRSPSISSSSSSRSRSRSHSRSHSRSQSRPQSRPRSRSRSRSLSRSSTAGPPRRNRNRNRARSKHPLRRPSAKTAAIFIAAIAVAAICVHRFWPRGIVHAEKERWEHPRSAPRRRLRRRNVVRDRHNGYIEDYERSNRRRLPEREHYPAPRGPRGRRHDDESDGESYYSDGYYPDPDRTRYQERLDQIDDRERRRLAEEGKVPVFGGPRDEVVRYEKPLTARPEAEESRFFDEDRRYRRRYGDVLDDWNRRSERAFASPSDERRPEPVFDDRRSRRRSRMGDDY